MEMEENRMVKHVFAATSSPSVANFCLRNTSQMHREALDAEVVVTVKCNMYVDVLMKLTNTTEKAVDLANKLRRLLQKGGFRLTKCTVKTD